jgi:hypothetical protein
MTAVAKAPPSCTVPTGDGFRWWPELVVRGAGFAACGVRRLADPELGGLADELIDTSDDPEAWQRFRAAFASAATALGVRLREIAGSPSFQRAVAWQNHSVLPGAIESFLRRPATEPRNHETRRREELVASYWQRYCLKNDSIGFFGPVAWARWRDQPHTEFTSGAHLVRRATVYFETWAIDRLVERIGTTPGLRRWLAPRRMPYLTVEGTHVVLPTGTRVALSPVEARVLRECDGTTRAVDLDDRCDGEVLSVLADLERRRLITWRIELPATPYPERALREVLAGIDDPAVRADCLAPLNRLERCRAAVASATDVAALTDALTATDRAFQELTGSASSRNGGHAYGGRTPLYQDCVRDLDAVFGQDVMSAAEPVELLAMGCRWLCRQAAETARATLLTVYRRVAGDAGSCSLSRLWAAALGPLHKDVSGTLAALRGEYVSRWASVFRIPPGVTEARRTHAELFPVVRAAFATTGPAWAGARYLSPDLMISATDLDAVRRGDFQLVVGEIHLGMNSQRSNCFVRQHPAPESLLAHVDDDFPVARLLPAPPRGVPVRYQSALTRDRDLLVEFHHHTVPAGRPGLLTSGEITVTEQAGGLLATVPDGRRFDLLDVYSEVLMDLVLNEHSLFTGRVHSPRVVVDRVVVARETWRFTPAQAPFATEKDEVRRFVAARAWRVAAGLPERVFVKVGAIDKPVYVDFGSPVLVNILAKMLRAAAPDEAVGFTELLPDLDHLWLVDRDGERYTSELRFAMVDQLGVRDGEDAR